MNRRKNLGMVLAVCVFLAILVVPASGRTIYVDPNGSADSNSIQAAINGANAGDQIEVAPGTYKEAINFNGKAIKLYSSGGPQATTIDATGIEASVVTCTNGEDANTILEGFTITGGSGTGGEPSRGGGMYNLISSPTVTNCIFSSNTCTGRGGGMCNYGGSNPTVTNCNFSGNKAGYGGGMHNSSSSPTVTNCNFIGNTGYTGGGMSNEFSSNSIVTNCTFISNGSNGRGAGMMNFYHASPTVTNCNFSKNSTVYTGGGMANEISSNSIVTNCTFSSNTSSLSVGGGMSNQDSNPTVTNCILWNDTPDEIYNSGITPTVTYSDVKQGYAGTGNIDADPMFTDALNGDYRLLSGSPCIDVGNNAAVPADITTDLDGHPRIVNNTVDMGAYEIPAKTGIKGTVVGVDSSGKVSGPLAGSTVALSGQETAITVTDSNGNFSFLNISAGDYTVTITKSGYYDVSSDIYIEENEILHEVFQLAAYKSGSPVGYDFVSPGGKHFIEGIPGDISFDITVAWNGAPGNVNFCIGNDCYPATVTDLGGGLARASLTIPAPSIVNNPSKLIIDVVNG
ncbi:MAG: right-handed parallel beta-helix repeat-containing protein, partial [Planctomycetota bacterium]